MIQLLIYNIKTRIKYFFFIFYTSEPSSLPDYNFSSKKIKVFYLRMGVIKKKHNTLQ